MNPDVQGSDDTRHPGFKVKIAFVLMMVSGLKLCTSLIPFTDYNSKMQWDGGLFLALVSFNYIVAGEVPKASVARFCRLLPSGVVPHTPLDPGGR